LGIEGGHAPYLAAFANAAAAHAMDFDDNCYAGFVHGSAVIVPALLACAQAAGATGRQVVTAMVAGAECEYAVGAATRGVLYDHGWWTTGVFGPIGASIAAAHIFRMDPARTHHALSLAIGMASGTKSCFGSDAKPLMAGKAAEAGVMAAYLAMGGATAAADPLQGTNGLAARFNDDVFDASALDKLGTEWYLRTPGIDVKRIPVCLSSHATVDILRELISEHRFSAADVARITCDVPPIVIANLRYDLPDTPEQARFSMPFAVGMTLLDPDWGLPALSPQQLAQDGFRDLMRRVEMVTGPRWDDPALREIAPEGAQVQVEMKDGRLLQASKDKAAGSPHEPLTEAQIRRKFLDCATPATNASRAGSMLAILQNLDSSTPIQALFDALA
jgi:2-methylcitrate dehydratase PrpD